ncbi:oxidation resistance protein 1-like isoform X2 [Acomys russatus]|uniref:oxidation resistance protein 1-like isoform X2 n=1 Tax=Acomys russatus TaxID=60746 RepID=UPI0021E311CD|nr:oxidation resistance protein 1-like isoform X2 [Acomys russatus]
MSVSNLSWLKKKSQSVDITAPGFNPLGAGKQAPQASKPPAPKTPIIEEEQNNSANTQKHPSRKSELKRFYTIGYSNQYEDTFRSRHSANSIRVTCHSGDTHRMLAFAVKEEHFPVCLVIFR